MTNTFVLTFILAFIIQILFFSIAATFKTDKVTDLAYGLTFVILAWYLFLTQSAQLPAQIWLTLMITLWGIRLAAYLFIRIIKMGRDKRFDGIREKFISFLKFWIFQALAIGIIMLPSTYLLSSDKAMGQNFSFWLGIVVFFFGLAIEAIADWQKFVFKNNPQNKGQWIETGLWKYSRYPNYFGEMTLWWGIFIFTLNHQTDWSYLTILGPLSITYILLFVSGIPPLEKRYESKYKKNKKYQLYKKQTSLLIPWPKKK